jgi:hypothetical protein
VGSANATGSFSDLAAGTYKISITDANSCNTVTGNVVVTENPAISFTATPTDTKCNASTDGAIAISSVSGGSGAGYTYFVNGSQVPSANVSGLAANTYSITVKDGLSCQSAASSVTVSSPAAITYTVPTATNVNCNGGSTGTISVTGNGGTSPLSFQLQTSTDTNVGSANATGSFSDLAAGTYKISITDANSCNTVTGNVVVTENPAISFTATPTDTKCNASTDGAIAISSVSGGSGAGYTYFVNGSQVPSANVSGLVANTYSITVKDGLSCQSAASSVTVSSPAAITYTVPTATNVNCNGGSTGTISVTGNGGTSPLSFQLQTSTGTNVGSANATGSFSDLAAGTYKISITDANSCNTVTGNVVVTENPAISFTATPTDTKCNASADGVIAISSVSGGSGAGYTYFVNGSQVPSANVSGLAANTYSITVKDGLSCQSAASSVTVSSPAAITYSNVNISKVTCKGLSNGTIGLENVTGGTAGYSFEIQDQLGKNPYETTDNINQTGTFANLPVNIYKIVITDANSCTQIADNIALTENPAIQFSLKATPSTCSDNADGKIEVSEISGGSEKGYMFTLNNGTPQSETTFTTLSAGTYTITATDDLMCPSAGKQVTVNAPLAINYGTVRASDISCPGSENGSIILSGVSGGTGARSYKLLPSNITDEVPMFMDLKQGSDYAIEITDANGCKATTPQITIAEPSKIVITSVTLNEFNISIEAEGGSGYFQYVLSDDAGWENIKTSSAFNNLSSGIYTIKVEDLNCKNLSAEYDKTITIESVGIDVNKQYNLNVYPNPSEGLITITGTWKEGTSLVKVTDVLGKTVYIDRISCNGNINTQLDLQFLTKGLYFLKIGDKVFKLSIR